MSNEKSATVTKLTVIAPRQYPDLHEHLDRLEREGLLIRVKEPVDKDQEMHPLVRWQFRGGIKEKDRKAFLFEKPVDAKGKTTIFPSPSAFSQPTEQSTESVSAVIQLR